MMSMFLNSLEAGILWASAPYRVFFFFGHVSMALWWMLLLLKPRMAVGNSGLGLWVSWHTYVSICKTLTAPSLWGECGTAPYQSFRDGQTDSNSLLSVECFWCTRLWLSPLCCDLCSCHWHQLYLWGHWFRVERTGWSWGHWWERAEPFLSQRTGQKYEIFPPPFCLL